MAQYIRWKKATVVTVPTDKSVIAYRKDLDKRAYWTRDKPLYTTSPNTWQAVHLYLTTNDQINDCDWVYNTKSKKVIQYRIMVDTCETIFCKKIIASTDFLMLPPKTEFSSKMERVPNLDSSFIKSFSLYSDVETTLVEYEEYDYEPDGSQGYFEEGAYKYKIRPRVNKENIVTIQMPKKTWDRTEIEYNIMMAVALFAAERGLTPYAKDMKVVNEWSDKWCNENL